MMSNPGEYHTMMYEFFFHGNLPVQRTDADGKVTSTKLTPTKAMNEFEQMIAAQQDPEKVAKRKAALEAKLAREQAERDAKAAEA
jgi:hypothetical protein